MIFFGDGREERIAATILEIKLSANPAVTLRKEAYERSLKRAFEYARTLTKGEIINQLVEHNPAYIRDLLESEDDRFGKGALAQRYAATFRERFVE